MQNTLKLTSLIEILNTNPYSGVSITNATNGEVLYSNLSSEKIKEQFSDAESLFNSIHESGITKLIIQEKRKNGSVYKSIGASFFIETESESTESKSLSDLQSQSLEKPVTSPKKSENNIFGLGQVDVMNLMLDSRDAKRLQNENELLKSENKRLEADNKELKEKELKDKYDANKKSANNELIAGLAGQAPAIIATLKGLFSPAPVGLAGELPPVQNLHPINEIDNTTKDILYLINNEMMQNEQFSTEFFELLKKHNLWEQ